MKLGCCPFWPLSRCPNFTSTYHGSTLVSVYHSVLNVKALVGDLVGAFAVIMKSSRTFVWSSIRKLRNQLSSMSKLPPWTSLAGAGGGGEQLATQLKVAIRAPEPGHGHWSHEHCSLNMIITSFKTNRVVCSQPIRLYWLQDLTNTFLHIISGGEPVRLLEVIMKASV